MSRIIQYFFITFFCFNAFVLPATEAEKKHKTICVNMIVKNESKVIKRCLGSLKPIIDYWVIVDTGSTDGTQEIIKEFMKDIPGELHERPWKNFGHNRTEAIQLAKGKSDYILIIDADEILRIDPDFVMPDLDKDLYYITTEYGGMKYARAQLVNNHLNWNWVGVLHEYLDCPDMKTKGSISGLTNVVYTDGARSNDPKKYQKDAEILEAALKDDPDNVRNVFYLAQSYRDAGDNENSLKNYQRRIAMGGWDQEVFWSRLQAAQLEEALKKPPETIIRSYLEAYNYRPTRVEPLYRLSHYLRDKGDFLGAYILLGTALNLPVSNDVLFVEHWMYDWGLLLEYSINAYWIGKYEESKACCEKLLAKKDLPQNVLDCLVKNLAFANTQLEKIEQLKKANAAEEAMKKSAAESLAPVAKD